MAGNEQRDNRNQRQSMIHKQTKLLDSSPCPVSGKHTGKPMSAVPAAYLDWLVGQEHLCRKYPEVVEYVARNRHAIDEELDDEDEDGPGGSQYGGRFYPDEF